MVGLRILLHRPFATIHACFLLPSNNEMVLQVGIHCSRRDMGRKKGGMVQKDTSLESASSSSIGVKKASSPLQPDKTGSSTLINIAAKPGARHSSITDYSEVKVLLYLTFSFTYITFRSASELPLVRQQLVVQRIRSLWNILPMSSK